MTLIEIMIVVSIIGVLALTATLAIRKIIEKSRIAQAEQDLARLASAIYQLAWDTGDWPSVEPSNWAYDSLSHKHTRRATNDISGNLPEVWDLSSSNAGLVATDGVFKGWKGPYIQSIPKDPWGRDYFFDPDYKINYTGVDCQVVGCFGPPPSKMYDKGNIYVVVKKSTAGKY
jgi:prepilin-type N-terminal cleavage/methylation domain-containing protein